MYYIWNFNSTALRLRACNLCSRFPHLSFPIELAFHFFILFRFAYITLYNLLAHFSWSSGSNIIWISPFPFLSLLILRIMAPWLYGLTIHTFFLLLFANQNNGYRNVWNYVWYNKFLCFLQTDYYMSSKVKSEHDHCQLPLNWINNLIQTKFCVLKLAKVAESLLENLK